MKMEKVIFICLTLFCTLYLVDSFTIYSQKLDKCVFENILVNPGEVKTHRDTCTEIFCRRGLAIESECPEVSVVSGMECEIVQDKTKDYPDCCPSVKCENSGNQTL